MVSGQIINSVDYADEDPVVPLYEVKEGILHLNFHPGQLMAWEALERFIFVVAGSQSGKTSFGPFWLEKEIELKGQGDYLAVTANFDLFKLKMLPSLLEVFEGVLKNGRYWAGDKVIEIKDPNSDQYWAKRSHDPMYARIILRSAVAKGGLESTSAKGAWLDECGQDEFTLGTWEAVRRRLSLSRGRVLGTTTPFNLGWLKREIIDKWKKGDPTIRVIRFPSIMNPQFSRGEWEDVQSKMAPWKFNMMYRGFFTRPAGMIYEDFIDKDRSRGGHRVKDFPIPSDWPIFIGVDPGSDNITKIWMAYNPVEDVYYIFRERHGGKKSTMEHVSEILNDAFEADEHIEAIYVGAKSESQQRMDWKTDGDKWLDDNIGQIPDGFGGFYLNVPEPDITDVEAGIDRVIALLRTFRLFFFESCQGTLQDIREYARELDDLDLPTDKIKDKGRFHYADGVRYVVSGVTGNVKEFMMFQGSVLGRD